MKVQIWKHRQYGWLRAVKLEDDGTVFDVQKVNEQKAQDIIHAGDFDAFADTDMCRLLEMNRDKYEVIDEQAAAKLLKESGE